MKIHGFTKNILKVFNKNNQTQSDPRLDVMLQELTALKSKVAFLEERLLSYYKNRWDAIDKTADYLVGAEIPGEYCEFGVFQGRTFSYAAKLLAPLFPKMNFIALDSFEGLPKPVGVDAFNNYSSGFYEGQFTCSAEDFICNLKNSNIDVNRVKLIKGWFSESLVSNSIEVRNIDKVAVAWIDCDLYESTIPILDFLTPRLSVGSILLFDDWRCFRNLEEFGEQRACREWLLKNPQITLNDFITFGFHGKAFTVRSI